MFGVMCVTGMTIFRLPYALLIGVVIAFTALIPVLGAFIGCVIIAALNNGLNMMNVSAYWTDFVRGLIILIAITFDAVRKLSKKDD